MMAGNAANAAGAVPPAQPPAPLVPAPLPNVSFCSHVFNDPSKDPEAGQYANLLNPFLLDISNPANNP